MRIIILESSEAVSSRAAEIFCRTIHRNPQSVLGLATGGTPLGTYRELVRRHRVGEVSFAGVTTFNLDEYVGLPAEHSQSYASFMQQHLFGQADFVPQQCHLPNGQADDLGATCAEYERQIDEAGGIDLQLLGIGSDGHIAFNEPGSSLASRTRVKALTERTRQDNARFFEQAEDVPKLAITMGIGSILDAERIVLLATGANKADAVQRFVEGPISAQMPASALQLHPQVDVLLDEAAAAQLERREYYEYVESLQRELETR